MRHISGLGVSATCLGGNGKAGGRALATRPKRRTRKYQIGNDRWVPDVLISGPVVFLCRPSTYGGQKLWVVVCAAWVNARWK